MSPRIVFENELRSLEENLTLMAQKAGSNYEKLFLAWEAKDRDTVEQIQKTAKNATREQREVESQCLFIISKQQPIVSDLRKVTAVLKAVTDIERVSDHIVDIAELLLRLNLDQPEPFTTHIRGMVEATKEMYHGALEAFQDRNYEKSNYVIKHDDVVDELFNKVKKDIISTLKEENTNVDDCVDFLMFAKYLEKIADHAVNICLWEQFIETGNIDDMRLL